MTGSRRIRPPIVHDRLGQDSRRIGGTMFDHSFGSYRTEVFLGWGSTSTVHRGVHEATQRTVAIKVARQRDGPNLERFQRSAEVLRELRHPSIPRFVSFGRSHGLMYLVTDYVAGRTLDDMISALGAMPWPDVAHIGLRICDVLGHIHQHGVVHRGLKPAHFMLTADSRLVLIGFGLAKPLHAAHSVSPEGMPVGTPGYMAPEQICGTPELSHKSDLYALGCVLYQLLTGRPPFTAEKPILVAVSHLQAPPPRPSRKVRVPRALDDLVIQLMSKAPGERPGNAAEVARVLSQLVDPKMHRTRKEALPNSSRHRLWRWLFRAEDLRMTRATFPSLGAQDTLWDRDLDS
jgi:eukaryotic-like serine/threonine-protein kinase